MVVVLELFQWKKVVPVVLLFVDEDLEVLIQFLVDMFHLSIHLQMPCHGGF